MIILDHNGFGFLYPPIIIIIINNCHDILLPQHSHTNHTPPTINSFSPSELPFKRQGSYLEGSPSPPPFTKSSSDVMSTSDRSDNDVRPTKETSNNCFLPSSKVLKPRDNQFVEGKLPPIYQQDVSLCSTQFRVIERNIIIMMKVN